MAIIFYFRLSHLVGCKKKTQQFRKGAPYFCLASSKLETRSNTTKDKPRSKRKRENWGLVVILCSLRKTPPFFVAKKPILACTALALMQEGPAKCFSLWSSG